MKLALQHLIPGLMVLGLLTGTATGQDYRVTTDGASEVSLSSGAPHAAAAQRSLVERWTSSGSIPEALAGAGVEELFNSGSFITCTGCVEGADASVLENTSLGMSLLGAGHNQAVGQRVADWFVVLDGFTWDVEFVQTYAYQTGSETTSTITGVSVRIWDGQPGVAGSNVIYGDPDQNVMIETEWSEVYRVSQSTVNTARPIMVQTSAVSVSLQPGVYWLDWAATGTIASGPWANPLTYEGECETGEAVQFTSAGWNPLADGPTECQQGLPFRIFGQSIAVSTEGGPSADVVSLGSAFPNPAVQSSSVSFTLPETAEVSLALFDLLGRQVAVIEQGQFAAGQHVASFSTSGLATGTYVLRLTAGEAVQTSRVSVVR